MTPLRPGLRAATIALPLALAACSGNVDPGDPGDSGAPSPPPAGSAVALTAAQLGGSVCGSPSGPATLYLELGAPAPTCADPEPGFTCSPTATFSLTIAIPPAMLQPGTLSLTDPTICTHYTVVGAEHGPPTSCPPAGGWETGPLYGGELTIVSIDAASVTFTLPESTLGIFAAYGADTGSSDGTFVAARCP